MGPWIAKRRTAEVQKKYSEIGGGSPILQWTNKQGELLCEKLDKISPETAPHKYYVAFRYADPLTDETLERMHKYGHHISSGVMQYKHAQNANAGRSFRSIFKLLLFSATGYIMPYFFLSIPNIVARPQVPVLMPYINIIRLGDYIFCLTLT